MKSFFNFVVKFFLKKKDAASQLYVLSVFIFVGSLFLGGWFLWQTFYSDKNVVGEVEVIEEDFVGVAIDDECDYRRLIDGVCVDSEDDVSTGLVGIMVENHIQARPLSGISEASVVYEAPVEGHITRFFAIYTEDVDVKKVGPVRSARPYYLDWASEYGDIMYMHVGGSPEALSNLKDYGMFDMNEFYRGWYFWRGQNRYAPHNVYTSSKLWQKAWNDYGDEKNDVDFDSWKFGLRDRCQDECVSEIEIGYNGFSYSPTWKFSSSTGKYLRYERGRIARDEDGDKIEVDTLILQYIDAEVIDSVGRLSFDTIGSGDVVIFRDGYAIEGEWLKDSRKVRTSFIDSEGDDILLGAGKIWVSIASQFVDVEY